MAYLDSFAHKEAYSNQVEIPGITSIIDENIISQATYGNHCELSATTILAVWNDQVTLKGMMRIGTRVSDFAIEWGTAVEFNATAVASIIPVRVSDTKFLLVYRDSTNYGTTICGTVAGTVPTLGTKLVFNATTTYPIGSVLMDTDKVMIAFANSTTNGQAVIASLTGTTISYGTVATFVATTDITGYTTLTQLCKHSITLASVAYKIGAAGATQVVTLSLSGTTITPNTGGLISLIGDIRYPSIGALSSTSFVVAHTDVTDTNKGNAQIGTIVGTTITAGASKYAFDANDYSTRISTVAVISSTLFAVSYRYAKICSVSGTVITLGTELQIDAQPYKYPSSFLDTPIRITYTKSGQLTFSYLTNYLNQFVCGMLIQNYTTIDLVPMCVKVASAGAGEQVEISSVYLKSNNTGFLKATTLAASQTGSIYFNGTLNKKFLSTHDREIFNTTVTASGFPETISFDKANNPIILTAGQSLYVSIDTNQGTSLKKGSCTLFGLKRSV